MSYPLDWDHLLPVRHVALDADSFRASHTGKTVLVTGAGGSIGSALVRSLVSAPPELLILLDHSEGNLYEIESELRALPNLPPLLPVLGDAGDRALLSALFEQHRPSLIYHAAAFKHVPLMEANPFAAVRNNALATWNLAKLAAEHHVARLLLISTDKAANARSIMGVSKRLAELAVLCWNTPETQCSAIRLGNVLGSHGSVVPRFLRQIAHGGPVTVTHREVARYFLTITDTVNLILNVASQREQPGLFLPEMGQPTRIHDLADRLIRLLTAQTREPIAIEVTGLRPGDKLNEDLLSPGESLESSAQQDVHRILGPQIPANILDELFRLISAQVESRDMPALLESIHGLVPEYQPSQALLESIPRPTANTSADD